MLKDSSVLLVLMAFCGGTDQVGFEALRKASIEPQEFF